MDAVKKVWRDNASPIYHLGIGLALGLLFPTLWDPGTLVQVSVGWSILAVSVLGLFWEPVGDAIRRRIRWLPDPPLRPRILRGRSSDRPPIDQLGHDGDLWLTRAK